MDSINKMNMEEKKGARVGKRIARQAWNEIVRRLKKGEENIYLRIRRDDTQGNLIINLITKDRKVLWGKNRGRKSMVFLKAFEEAFKREMFFLPGEQSKVFSSECPRGRSDIFDDQKEGRTFGVAS